MATEVTPIEPRPEEQTPVPESTPSLSEHCVSDQPISSGEAPTGEISQLGGISAYITKPADYPHTPSKLLLLLTGGTGFKSPNNQLQADKYAAEGFLVVMPDQFDGDEAPKSVTETTKEATLIEKVRLGVADTAKSFLIDMFLARNTPEKVLPILHKVIDACKSEFPDSISYGGGIYGVGYCIGAKFILLLAHSGAQSEGEQGTSKDEEHAEQSILPTIKAGAVAHGAQISPDDLSGVKVPMSFVCIEDDPLFPDEVRDGGMKRLQEGGIDHEVKIFNGVPHGFAVLGDYDDTKIMEEQKQAFCQMSAWLKSH